VSRARIEAAFDAAAPVAVFACIVAAAGASSIQYTILAAARPVRWVLIAVLFVTAFARAILCGRGWRLRGEVALPLAAFLGLAFVSDAWSVAAHATLTHAVAQGAVLAAVAALAGCIASRPLLARRLLDAVLAAAVVVAVAGIVYWLIDPRRSFLQATTQYPSRFQGIEQNPDTAPLLLAIGMPLAFARALTTGSARARLASLAVVIVFAVEIALSGSRGGLIPAFLALVIVAALVPLGRLRRAALAAAVVGGFVLAAWGATLPKALPAAPAPAPATTTLAPTRNAQAVLPFETEIGSPFWTHRSGALHRSFFQSSERLRAWHGTIDQALDRPLLGYGYGAEKEAFVNRYYGFRSENPENGYIGIFLQLGAVGLGLLLVVLAVCIRPSAVAAARGNPVALAAFGASAAAALAAGSQSFFHAPGSIAYVALWVSLLVASTPGLNRAISDSAPATANAR
jgi:hypothetical protein